MQTEQKGHQDKGLTSGSKPRSLFCPLRVKRNPIPEPKEETDLLNEIREARMVEMRKQTNLRIKNREARLAELRWQIKLR